MESSMRSPRVSITTGINSTPANLHVERWEDYLHWVQTCRAWPGVDTASFRVCCWRGEITCTPKAASRPRLQVGWKSSAGLERESEIRLGISLTEARAADWAALRMTSWMAMCRVILFLLPPTTNLVVNKRISCIVAFRAGVRGAV